MTLWRKKTQRRLKICRISKTIAQIWNLTQYELCLLWRKTSDWMIFNATFPLAVVVFWGQIRTVSLTRNCLFQTLAVQELLQSGRVTEEIGCLQFKQRQKIEKFYIDEVHFFFFQPAKKVKSAFSLRDSFKTSNTRSDWKRRSEFPFSFEMSWHEVFLVKKRSP